MAQVPQHPGRAAVAPQQEGLGAPVAQATANPYFVPNQTLQGYTAKVQPSQVVQAPVTDPRAIAPGQPTMAPQQGLEPAPSVSPQEVQAQQLAEGLLMGELSPEALGQAIQAGQVDKAVAEAAMGMAQEMSMREQQATQAQNQGLGGGF